MWRAMITTTHVLLLIAYVRADASQEESAFTRMLTLHQRTMFSDRPLELSELPAAAGVKRAATGRREESCNASSSTDWRSAVASPWQAAFTTSETLAMTNRSELAIAVEHLFTASTRAVRDAQFPEARQQLYQACLAGQALLEALPAPQQARSAGIVLQQWVSDCGKLLQYVPIDLPVREDHKRLLMLLHDLGGNLLLYGLLGILPEMVIQPAGLSGVAEAIEGFGESNRKTAFSRALGMGCAVQPRLGQAIELLRQYGLCAESEAASAEATVAADSEKDVWGEVGMRLCSVLLLRSGRADRALSLIKQQLQRCLSWNRNWDLCPLGAQLDPGVVP